jgi:hypothetical protein
MCGILSDAFEEHIIPELPQLRFAALDDSVASQHGLLAAYRWSGEATLPDANLMTQSRV